MRKNEANNKMNLILKERVLHFGVSSFPLNPFIFVILVLALFIVSCTTNKKDNNSKNPIAMADSLHKENGYSDVNGIKMYYEIHGQGEPLVLIHGGGSTIESTFGRVIPQLAQHYKVIAMDLQNHGRSGFRDLPQTFEQDANDVVTLLKNLGINKAHFFGFSNGGHTSIEIALRYPEMINKLIIASAPYKRDCFFPAFFDMMAEATLKDMPIALREDFLSVTPDSAKLQTMFTKDRDRMIAFKGWTDEQINSITAPTLVINGDADVMSPECAVEMHRLIKGSQLAILPGGHGDYILEITTFRPLNTDCGAAIAIIKKFLDHPVLILPK